ncbi:MAG TPA: heavy metal-binding domain-containing protein [Polyangia bacterium]|jgi:tetrahydromethanopterin S-methyltransferase subunit E
MFRFRQHLGSWRRAALWMIASLAFGAAVPVSAHALHHVGSHIGVAAKEVKYHCPMHPEVTSDKAGDCPKCGMKLEPIKDKQ